MIFFSNVGAKQAKDIVNANSLKDAAANGDELAERTDQKDFTAQFTLKDEAGKGVKDIRYEIHIDNNTATAGDDIVYRFTFQKENEDPSTFFNIRLGKQNL